MGMNIETDKYQINHDIEIGSFSITSKNGGREVLQLKEGDAHYNGFRDEFSVTGPKGLNGLVDRYIDLVGGAVHDNV